MQLTEVKVYPVTDDEKLKGYATIVFDACFVVRDLKIINGNSGLFVAEEEGRHIPRHGAPVEQRDSPDDRGGGSGGIRERNPQA